MKSAKSMPSAFGSGANRFRPGDTITARELTTIQSELIRVPARDGLTHLQFRRFAGCPICNLHLRSVARRHDEILAAGISEVVVFFTLRSRTCWPTRASCPSPRSPTGPPGVCTPRSASKRHGDLCCTPAPGRRRYGRKHTRSSRAEFAPGGTPGPRGQTMLGLPADFLIAPNGRILAAKYGQHANDQWDVDELLHLAQSTDH